MWEKFVTDGIDTLTMFQPVTESILSIAKEDAAEESQRHLSELPNTITDSLVSFFARSLPGQNSLSCMRRKKMKFSFEADMKKGECKKCILRDTTFIDNWINLCGLDNAPVKDFRDPSECPLKEDNEQVGIQWHPYPKEKPTQSGYYLVTLNMFGKIFVHVHPSNGTFDVPVIAWAELPKPFRVETWKDTEEPSM